jgi:hypothetical protein
LQAGGTKKHSVIRPYSLLQISGGTNNFPFCSAAENGHLEVVKLFVKLGA